MSKEIKIKHRCATCSGTGLYVGILERDGAAVVCNKCKGLGWQEEIFVEFAGREERKGVCRVFQASSGIVIGDGEGIKLSDFGGMPLSDWLAGKQFERGMENRTYTCPQQWAQSAVVTGPNFEECKPGHYFSQCRLYANKSECWGRWDRENEAV